MNSPPGPLTSLRDNFQEIPPIILILENRLPPVATSHDVVECAGYSNLRLLAIAQFNQRHSPLTNVYCTLTPNFLISLTPNFPYFPNMMDLKNGNDWPSGIGTRGDDWFHSDFRVISLNYVWPMWQEMIDTASLDQ